jgi:TetR/AcrR family transcriptional repressor of bet genes
MAKNAPIRSNRRKELIEATIAVIATHGYHGTTVSRVAKKAGVSTGLMNFHFKTKDKLFEAVFEFMADEYQQVWTERVAASKQEPWPLLQTMIATYFDRDVFNNERLSVWFAFWSDPALRDKFRDEATAVERRYVQRLEYQLCYMLEFHAHRDWAARNVTSALSAMIDGYWLQALLYPKRFKPKDAIRKCTDFVRTVMAYHYYRRETGYLPKELEERIAAAERPLTGEPNEAEG